MARYNGKNHFNNNITVDFKKKTVQFKPVCQGSLTKYFFITFLPYISFSFIFVQLIGVLLIFNWLKMIHYYTFVSLTIYFFRMVYITLFTSFLIHLQFLYKPWRENYFPKYNATLLTILHFLDGKIHLKWVRPKALKGNVYILPLFANVKLNYTLHGDFATKIEKIEIRNHMRMKKGKLVDSFNKWYAVFTFDSPVNSGHMFLDYL